MRSFVGASIQGGQNDGKNIKGNSRSLFIDKFAVGALRQSAVALVHGLYWAKFFSVRVHELVSNDVGIAEIRG